MGEGPGAILSFETFFSFINIQLKTNRGVLFLPPSDAYVRSFLYLLYTLIKLRYMSSERSSLVSGPRLNSSPLGAKNPGILIQQQPFTSTTCGALNLYIYLLFQLFTFCLIIPIN